MDGDAIRGSVEVCEARVILVVKFCLSAEKAGERQGDRMVVLGKTVLAAIISRHFYVFLRPAHSSLDGEKSIHSE